MKVRQKQLVTAEAVQWWPPTDPGHDPTLMATQADGIKIENGQIWRLTDKPGFDDVYQLRTPKGDIPIQPGDWLIIGPRGEKFLLRREMFDAGYEPVPALHLWRNTDGDAFVAETSLEAAQLMLARCEEIFGQLVADTVLNIVFEQIPDDEDVKLEEDIDGIGPLAMKAEEWVVEKPKGYFGVVPAPTREPGAGGSVPGRFKKRK